MADERGEGIAREPIPTQQQMTHEQRFRDKRSHPHRYCTDQECIQLIPAGAKWCAIHEPDAAIPTNEQRMSAEQRFRAEWRANARHWASERYGRGVDEAEWLLTALADIAQLERERDAARAERDEAHRLIDRTLDDFAYLERSYRGSLWTTGAGYTLQPRVLELRAYRAPKAEVVALLTEEPAKP